jgi:hypothetical protein
MSSKPKHVMKVYLVLFLILILGRTFAQADSITIYFEKLINRKIQIPDSFFNDSCFLTSTLLKVDADNNASIKGINFSDNAETWLKECLPRIVAVLDKQKVRKYLTKANIKGKSVVIPVIVQSSYERCLSKNDFHWSESYFEFNRIRIQGDCFITAPVKLVLGNLVH